MCRKGVLPQSKSAASFPSLLAMAPQDTHDHSDMPGFFVGDPCGRQSPPPPRNAGALVQIWGEPLPSRAQELKLRNTPDNHQKLGTLGHQNATCACVSQKKVIVASAVHPPSARVHPFCKGRTRVFASKSLFLGNWRVVALLMLTQVHPASPAHPSLRTCAPPPPPPVPFRPTSPTARPRF